MSYFEKINVEYADSNNLDATGRLRVSTLKTLFESKFIYDKQPLIWDEATSGTAGSTFISDSSIDMEVGDTLGDRIVRQTKRYVTYQPGKTQQIMLTGTLNSNPTTGIRSRIGYFDDKSDKIVGDSDRGNGVFFQLDGSTPSVGLRTTDPSTNTQTDTIVDQSSWNLDPLDGTGDSGFTLDPSKANLFMIDFIWLGVGRIRYGVYNGGETIYCHEIKNANINNSTFMNVPNLPVRYEIENVGGVVNTSILKQICATVKSESGKNNLNKNFSVDRGVDVLSVNNILTPAISIRAKSNRNRIGLSVLQIVASSITDKKNIRFALYLNPTLTGASWIDSHSNNNTEYDISATSIDVSNAVLLFSGYIINEDSVPLDINNELQAWADIAGNRDILTLAMQTTGDLGDVICSLNFQEIE